MFSRDSAQSAVSLSYTDIEAAYGSRMPSFVSLEVEVEAAWREVAPLRPALPPRRITNRPSGSSGLLSGPQPVYGQPSLFDLSA